MSYRILSERTFFHDQGFRVKVIKRDPEIPYSLHSHEFFELVIVLSGTGNHITKNEKQPISAGMAFLIRPHFEHGYEDVDNLILYNILIGKEVLSESMVDLSEIAGFKSLVLHVKNSLPILRLTTSQQEAALTLIGKIKKETEGMVFGKGTATMIYANLLQLIVMLSRSHQATVEKTKCIGNQRISKLITFLEQNLNRPISLQELASRANMSTSTLNRYFQATTGWSPIEFHIRRRVKFACSLIQTSKLTMEEISEATGFCDGNYFARQFRKVMAMSPRQYKRIWTSQSQA
ncbi:helix-turn-helix domain-containing protein [uncultured Sphaerochaeta sp.]|uniref:helix-turn-helix domain-containing protein n=1 Tax=uncultured Sphaerochaeta sp. TaxID=886478 RepID=UPI002A0A3362|nr:helix-turn-helix domain-containing protein [uncultured Sphaerochaeta sp.]